MCGIFAYSGDTPPDRGLLLNAAERAAARGPHGHGWWDGITLHHDVGPLPVQEIPTRGATQLLGHARLSSIGGPDPFDRRGLQPVVVDGHALALNGNVYNYRELAPNAATDAVALALLYAHYRADGSTPYEALDTLLAGCQMKAGVVVVLDASGALLAFRRRLPLNVCATATGLYLSSGAPPGFARLSDGQLYTLTPGRTSSCSSST